MPFLNDVDKSGHFKSGGNVSPASPVCNTTVLAVRKSIMITTIAEIYEDTSQMYIPKVILTVFQVFYLFVFCLVFCTSTFNDHWVGTAVFVITKGFLPFQSVGLFCTILSIDC